jgi:heat shock protein HtpX
LYANQNSEFCNYGVGFWVTTILTEILLASLASIVVFGFPAGENIGRIAVQQFLVGKKPMIEALETLRASINKRHLPEEMATFGISGTRKRGAGCSFRNPPHLADRIRALQESRIALDSNFFRAVVGVEFLL